MNKMNGIMVKNELKCDGCFKETLMRMDFFSGGRYIEIYSPFYLL